MAEKQEHTPKAHNSIQHLFSSLVGIIFVLVSTPFVLTGTAKFPVVGLGVGIILGFFGIAPFMSSDGISNMTVGLIIVSTFLVLTALLCIAGFICSFKPAMFEGRHGKR